METGKSPKKTKVFIRIILCSAVLFIGFTGMLIMAKMKKPPAEAVFQERPLKVEILKAEAEDVQVFIKAFGEVRSLNTVSIASEAAGKIVYIHPGLEPGEIIRKGELLFKIDPRNYKAAFNDAQARVNQAENTVKRLEKEYAMDKERLKTLTRSRELAKAEFQRLKKLYEKERVGTRSGVDAEERALNAAADIADQMSQAVEIYPIRIRESQAALESAKALLETAKANLERCEVRTDFQARVKESFIEAGQYVNPGRNAVTLADDSVLEIQVPLDSRDAKDWLRFNNDKGETAVPFDAWFSNLAQVPCKVRWTEDQEGHVWEGNLHRIVKFDSQTRTMTAAVRVQASEALAGQELPLVEGMFCSVEIPGKILKNIVRLPRWAVTFKNTVYIESQGRLKTIPVKVARVEGEDAFISEGLSIGDHVITTRLVDPLENHLLEIINTAGREERS